MTDMNTGAASLSDEWLESARFDASIAIDDKDGELTGCLDWCREFAALVLRHTATPQADAAPSEEMERAYQRRHALVVTEREDFEAGYRAAIAAGGAQEPSATLVKCRDMKGAEWFDIKVHDRSLPDGAKLYAVPLPREAATVPPEVIAWRDAYQAYVDTTAAYNSHLEYVRANCPFGTSVDAQYQAMNEAQRKAFSLLKPMHEALAAPAAASNGEQA